LKIILKSAYHFLDHIILFFPLIFLKIYILIVEIHKIWQTQNFYILINLFISSSKQIIESTNEEINLVLKTSKNP
jgi:hypothetical protein